MDERVFLDTTIILDYFFGSTNARRALREALRAKTMTTSSYVVGELQYSIVRDTVRLYALLADEASLNVFDALARITAYRGRTHRRLERLLASLGPSSARHYQNADEVDFNSKDSILRRLDLLLREGFSARFGRVMVLIDGTACQRQYVKPKFNGMVWEFHPNCQAQPAPGCTIVSFWSLHGTNAIACSKVNASGRLVADMLANKVRPYGQNCWKTGDIIIALECPSRTPLYTTNIKDFGPLGEALDKDIYNPLQPDGTTEA